MTTELASIGAQLQGARLARGASIEDVAHATRIPVPLLRSLEDGDYSIFSGMAYARSFLRLYGNYLEVDVSDGVATLEERRELAGDPAHYSFLKAPEEIRLSSELKRPRSRNLPLAAVALVLALVLAVPFALLAVMGYFGADDPDDSEADPVLREVDSGAREPLTDPLPPVIERVTPERLERIRNPVDPEVRRAEVVVEDDQDEDDDDTVSAPGDDPTPE